jgi:hypothetical protein
MPLEPQFPGEAQRTAGQNAVRLRCAACQLQLCKSRDESPHVALKETGGSPVGDETVYACATCATVLVRSGNPNKPGWSQRR